VAEYVLTETDEVPEVVPFIHYVNMTAGAPPQ